MVYALWRRALYVHLENVHSRCRINARRAKKMCHFREIIRFYLCKAQKLKGLTPFLLRHLTQKHIPISFRTTFECETNKLVLSVDTNISLLPPEFVIFEIGIFEAAVLFLAHYSIATEIINANHRKTYPFVGYAASIWVVHCYRELVHRLTKLPEQRK